MKYPKLDTTSHRNGNYIQNIHPYQDNKSPVNYTKAKTCWQLPFQKHQYSFYMNNEDQPTEN